MISGHFATALLARQKFPRGSLFFFLLASQFQDFLWFFFHYVGLEPTTPTDVFNATISNMSVVMVYSHHVVPQLVWAIVIFLIGRLVFKSTQIGLVGLALCSGHFVLDLLSGHTHYFFGKHTHQVGLGLYASNVYLAILIEAVFTIVVLWYFFAAEAKAGITRTFKNKAVIVGVFVYGIVFLLSVAKVSFRDMFGIPKFDLGFNTTVPLILLTYLGMVAVLVRFVPQVNRSSE